MPPERLHHHAYVVKDQEKNRQFFEDVLGIPLVATWCEQHFSPWVKRDVSFCHTFYGLGDGGALAFFSFADDEVYQKTQAEKPAEIGSFDHIAFKVDDDDVRRAGVAREGVDAGTARDRSRLLPVDVYARRRMDWWWSSPSIRRMSAEIDEIRRADAHAELARWVGGDHRVNNDLRVHEPA